MLLRLLAAALIAASIVACSAPAPGASPTTSPTAAPTSASPSPSASGPAASPGAVLADLLEVAGLDAREEEAQFDPAPLSAEATVVCVGDEPVRVYVYETPEDAAAVAATINPNSPSEVGTSMISWNGAPKFWLNDRSIVLYLGTEADVTTALVVALGNPFASGPGHAMLPENACS